MIEILDRETRAPLASVPYDVLAGGVLTSLDLRRADLAGADRKSVV